MCRQSSRQVVIDSRVLIKCADSSPGKWFLTQDSSQKICIENVLRTIQCSFGNQVFYGPKNLEPPFTLQRIPDRSNPMDMQQLRRGQFNFGFKNVPPFPPHKIHVDKLITKKYLHLVRDVTARHKSRGELEIEAYGRDHIINKFVHSDKHTRVYFMPTTQFIDAFALFGKGTASYFSMLGIYLTPANITAAMRKMLVNQYPLVLGPMGTNLAAATGCIAPGLRDLAWGIHTQLNGDNILFVAFDIAKIGIFTSLFSLDTHADMSSTADMPQANANSGIKSQRAVVCCRNCEVPYCDRSDLSYDRVRNGRYFALQERKRDLALIQQTQKAQQEMLQSLGLSKSKSIWIQTDPLFDPF